MTNLAPAMPTDSVYKFLSLFGLVLVAFGFYFPNERQIQIMAEMRDASKAQQLVKIRLERKFAQSKELLGEITTKFDALSERKNLLEKAETELQGKDQSLKEQIARMAAGTTSSDLKEAERAATVLKSETQTLKEKVGQFREEEKKLSGELKSLRAQQDELSDETAAATVSLKSDRDALDVQLVMMKWWLFVMCASILIGVIMIVVGFTLWYRRIQVHQDAILREQAAAKSSSRSAEG